MSRQIKNWSSQVAPVIRIPLWRNAQIITVALTTFIVRYITLNYHKNKIEEANSYYSSSILACFQLSGALLIFALLCIFKLEDLLKIPEKLIPSVKALFIHWLQYWSL